jgi:TPR repeat protein
VNRDYVEAAKWYQMAAEKGQAGAQYQLGYMYYAGKGVSQDNVQAYMWFALAAAQGQTDQRGTVAKRMTRSQIAKARNLARSWKPTGG